MGNCFCSCDNGADELDCVNIWPDSGNATSSARDNFGRQEKKSLQSMHIVTWKCSDLRYKTAHQGYVHFVAYGKKYLYCAGVEPWENNLLPFGRILCRNEGFQVRCILSRTRDT